MKPPKTGRYLAEIELGTGREVNGEKIYNTYTDMAFLKRMQDFYGNDVLVWFDKNNQPIRKVVRFWDIEEITKPANRE